MFVDLALNILEFLKPLKWSDNFRSFGFLETVCLHSFWSDLTFWTVLHSALNLTTPCSPRFLYFSQGSLPGPWFSQKWARWIFSVKLSCFQWGKDVDFHFLQVLGLALWSWGRALWLSLEMQGPVVGGRSAHDLELRGPSEAELFVYRCDLLRGKRGALTLLPWWSEIRVLVPFTPWRNGRTWLLSTLLCICECFLINPWYPLDKALEDSPTGPPSFPLLLIKTHGPDSQQCLLTGYLSDCFLGLGLKLIPLKEGQYYGHICFLRLGREACVLLK